MSLMWRKWKIEHQSPVLQKDPGREDSMKPMGLSNSRTITVWIKVRDIKGRLQKSGRSGQRWNGKKI